MLGNSQLFLGSSSSNSAILINKDGITLASSRNLVINTGNFMIDSAGNVSLTGIINATGGTLAGWHIESDYIWKGQGATCVGLGYAAYGGNANANYVFWAGASWPESSLNGSSSEHAPVRIRASGYTESGIHTTNLWLGNAHPHNSTT
jgi:hypothetical protein